MALGEEIARLAVALSMDTSEFATGSTKVQRDLGRLQASFKSLGDKWMQTGKNLSIGISAPLTAFGLLSAKTASDAQELDSAFTETFDNLSGSMREWAQETGDAMGRSTQAMQQMANTFGIFFNQAAPTRKEAAEMSKTFTVLAQDLSSFYNVSGDVALQKLRSGLSGESEPLRDFGVFLTEATVAAKAMEMGLTGVGDELTEQEKILARYQLILESTRDAQGDVARTSDGAANQWRSFTEALEELQVGIGQKLLPLLTPLVNGMTKVVNGFNNLPSGVQTAIVAVGAMMAAIGPMMLVMGTLAATGLPFFAAQFGPIGIAISAFINPLGTAISFLVQFAAKLGGLTILKTIGGQLLRFAGPLGLVATAGALIYQNWDRISALFQYFWATAQQTIGPPLQELIATITGAFSELWDGPLGEGIRGAGAVVSEFSQIVMGALGDQLINVLKALMEVALGVFRQIASAIKFVNAILTGDWQGAWSAAKSFVTNAVETILRVFRALAPDVTASMQRLYIGVKTWLQDKLGGVFDWVTDKVRKVERGFAWLYNEVVGNSWIPDMVEEVGQHMDKLQALMVDPATKATQDTNAAFQRLAANVSSIVDRLFPQMAALRDMQSEAAMIEEGVAKGVLSREMGDRTKRELGYEYRGGKAEPSSGTVAAPIGVNVDKTIEKMWELDEAIGKSGDKAEIQTVRIAESFKDMAQKTISALSGLVDAIKKGDFFSILESAVGIFTQLAGSGTFGKGLQANVNAIPGFATGTMSAPRGLALVGEQGPELVKFRGGERVWSNRDSAGMMGGAQVQIVPSPYFDVVVDGRAAAVAAPMSAAAANAGTAGAQMSLARSAKRRMA